MAPDFEIFQNIEIMRMISLLLPDLRLSATGTPELRIAAPDGWGMTYPEMEDVHSSELRIVGPCVRFRCIFGNYVQTNSRRIKFGWRETNLRQKQGTPTLYQRYGEINSMAFRG